ncbi:hypothetical protein OQA88_12321 [Cercophora sp. LCS_1]
MSAARPVARGLLSRRLAGPSTSSATPCHHFHSSAQLAARKRAHRGEMSSLVAQLPDTSHPSSWSKEKLDDFTKSAFPEPNKRDLEFFRQKYNREQLESIKEAETAVDKKDMAVQGRLRVDPYRLPYLDDLAEFQPVIDKRVRRQPPPNPMAKFMDMDEFTKDLIEWADKLPKGQPTGALKQLNDFVPEEFKDRPEGQWPKGMRDSALTRYMAYLSTEAQATKKRLEKGESGLEGGGPTDGDILRYIMERSSMKDNNLISNSEAALALPDKVPGVAGLYRPAQDPEDDGLDDQGIFQELKQRTGWTVKEILSLYVKVLDDCYVVNQTRLGKIRSFRVTAVAGNQNGWLGIATSKHTDANIARQKAQLMAIQNLRPVRRYEDRTIYGDVEAKISGTVVRLFTRPPGFGLRVPSKIFEMSRAGGFQDLAVRIPRSRNPLNMIKATYQALMTQPDPEIIAMGRGKKLVDARKVYYGADNVY